MQHMQPHNSVGVPASADQFGPPPQQLQQHNSMMPMGEIQNQMDNQAAPIGLRNMRQDYSDAGPPKLMNQAPGAAYMDRQGSANVEGYEQVI